MPVLVVKVVVHGAGGGGNVFVVFLALVVSW